MSNTISRLLIFCVVASTACVQSRPSRNGVFNDNQYVRKDFLVSNSATTPDQGWWLQGTITSVSTPNPLGSAYYGLSPGINSGAVPVRFVVTSDKLDMVSTREMQATDPTQPTNTPTVVNAWPVTNVDLMYQVNLDGETTNFYQTNQERPWEQREWVQVNFDKNDMSDIAPMGEYLQNELAHCVDMSNVTTTLVPESFLVDEPNNYMQWTVSVTLPLIWDDANCVGAYGYLGHEAAVLGKQSVTFNLMYSLTRQLPLSQVTYQPLVVDEKDPIHHKYGFFPNYTYNRDPSTGLLASQQMVERFDPTKPIVWYFAQGFNPNYKIGFTDPTNGVAARANAILAKAGVAARVFVKEYDEDLAPGQAPRQYGDIRYNFLVWMDDMDTQETFAGVTEFNVDYRTGEMMSDTIAFNEFAFQDYYVQRIDAYLQSVGASNDVNGGEWPATPTFTDSAQPTTCQAAALANSCPLAYTNATTGATTMLNCVAGSTLPISTVVDTAQHVGTSTVFNKMQTYMGLPASVYGPLGPQNFIAPPSATNDSDFFNAYYKLIQYQIYADPAQNFYTIPEGGSGDFGAPGSDTMWNLLQQETKFQADAALINSGQSPYIASQDTTGLTNAVNFANQFRTEGQQHSAYNYNLRFANGQQGMRTDGIDSLAFENVADEAARACQGGAWETKEQWLANVDQAYWIQVEFHEFGHSMGLTHNFMGSVDAPNYPTFTVGNTQVPVMHTSSIMEYNAAIDRVTFETPDYGPYDKGAIAWIYGNNTSSNDGMSYAPCTTIAPPCASLSGQASPTSPWKDPMGFNTSGATPTELNFLFCNEVHMAYTPLCRQGDLGRTPSEIVSNGLDSYEWEYAWRNFPKYHQFWDDSAYANTPQALFTDMQRFLAMWGFDWSSSEIADTLRLIGVGNPDPTTQSAGDYYGQLANKFDSEISGANQMVAAYAEAMIQQASGERPIASQYDDFYGDVLQQGIILDKYFAMQNFVGLWPVTNFDPDQAAGAYIANYEGLGDSPYQDLSQAVVVSMVGGGYNVYPYFVPLAVGVFAQDTHSPSFAGQGPNSSIRNWIGGKLFGGNGTDSVAGFLGYFQTLAQNNNWTGPGCTDGSGNQVACTCSVAQTCNYDPRLTAVPGYWTFNGPDGRRYIYSYIADRDQFVLAEQDTNIVTYQIMYGYNSDLNVSMDDGVEPGGAFSDELQVEYTIDAFTMYN